MTMTEQILASRAGKNSVSPGELINARVDFTMGHDLSAPLAIGVMKQMGATRVFNPELVALVNDHFVPARTPPQQRCRAPCGSSPTSKT